MIRITIIWEFVKIEQSNCNKNYEMVKGPTGWPYNPQKINQNFK